MEQLNNCLAESARDLSCRAFRCTSEENLQTLTQQAWGIHGSGHGGPDEATLWPNDLLGRNLPPNRLKQVSGRCDVRRLSVVRGPKKRLNQQQKWDPWVFKHSARSHEQHQVQTVVNFLKIDEKSIPALIPIMCAVSTMRMVWVAERSALVLAMALSQNP